MNALLLFVAVALLAATSATVKWLQVAQPLMVDSLAINFCNVLFVGNLLAGLVALGVFGPRSVARDLATTDRRTRLRLAGSALLAVAIPALVFTALERTSVTNVVLLGRFESVAFALLAATFLGERLRGVALLGYGTMMAGLIGLVLLESGGSFMRGDVLVIIAATLQGIAALLSRSTLAGCGLGAFVVVRNLVSAVVFLAIGLWWYGLAHFAHAFGPDLWVVMTVYAAVLVVGGQSLWYRSLARLPPATVANASMASPLLGIAAAWLLLDELPSTAQWIGAGIVLVGMVLVRRGRTVMPRPGELGLDRTLAG